MNFFETNANSNFSNSINTLTIYNLVEKTIRLIWLLKVAKSNRIKKMSHSGQI